MTATSTDLPPTRSGRALWVAGALVLVAAVAGLAWQFLSPPPAEPHSVESPPVPAPLATAAPSPESEPAPEPLAPLEAIDAGVVTEPPPSAPLDAGPAVAVRPRPVAPPVDRQKRLTQRLQQLNRRFAGAQKSGQSVDLELAEVGALLKKLNEHPSARQLDQLEGSVVRLEGWQP